MFSTSSKEIYKEQTIYQDQLKAGRATAALEKKPAYKATKQPTGHEMLLKILRETKKTIEVRFMDGSVVRGTIKAADKYTISLTVQTEFGTEEVVYFKHSIKGFKPLHNTTH